MVGGYKQSYSRDTSSQAVFILDTKLMFNSVISDASKGVSFLSTDLGDFFLRSQMKTPKYMRIPYSLFPQDIIAKYDLQNLVCEEGFIYIKIKKECMG